MPIVANISLAISLYIFRFVSALTMRSISVDCLCCWGLPRAFLKSQRMWMEMGMSKSIYAGFDSSLIFFSRKSCAICFFVHVTVIICSSNVVFPFHMAGCFCRWFSRPLKSMHTCSIEQVRARKQWECSTTTTTKKRSTQQTWAIAAKIKCKYDIPPTSIYSTRLSWTTIQNIHRKRETQREKNACTQTHKQKN